MLPTHKEGVSYLEHCQVTAADGRLSYSRADGAVVKHWAIPHGATACLLLGPGTSITHQAARLLGSEGVTLGFVGGDGTPLYFASQNEYRPTEYLQDWCSFWFSAPDRLRVAKFLLVRRAEFVRSTYTAMNIAVEPITHIIDQFLIGVDRGTSTEELLGVEAVFAKRLYALNAESFGLRFKRIPRSADKANQFLDQGNYLAYGLASAALWTLGIPHGMPVLHGLTRRGALVFDLADVIKDACILPAAFASAAANDTASQNRARCVASLERFRAFETLFSTMKDAIHVGSGR